MKFIDLYDNKTTMTVWFIITIERHYNNALGRFKTMFNQLTTFLRKKYGNQMRSIHQKFILVKQFINIKSKEKKKSWLITHETQFF